MMVMEPWCLVVIVLLMPAVVARHDGGKIGPVGRGEGCIQGSFDVRLGRRQGRWLGWEDDETIDWSGIMRRMMRMMRMTIGRMADAGSRTNG